MLIERIMKKANEREQKRLSRLNFKRKIHELDKKFIQEGLNQWKWLIRLSIEETRKNDMTKEEP